MSRELLDDLLRRMYVKLNRLIEAEGYDLSSSAVIKYSQRIDRVLLHYTRRARKYKNNH